MSIIACIIEGCERPKRSREWCHKHYEGLRSKGLLPPKLCMGCKLPVGPRKRYHSDACKPRCSVEGCGEIRFTQTWCEFHYTRWNIHGDPEAALVRTQHKAGQLCSFAECTNPARNDTLCKQHYNQLRRGNKLAPIAAKSQSLICAFCGGPSGIIKGYRRVCSSRCSVMFNKYGGPLPDNWTCVLCEKEFPYVVEGRRRIKVDVLNCDPCRSNASKHGYSAAQLAHRDGNECKICSEPVDMELVFPDLMRGSVDHILPKSRGGSNEPENVQLAHLHCNIKKNNRVDYVHA